jgi:signal peptidase
VRAALIKKIGSVVSTAVVIVVVLLALLLAGARLLGLQVYTVLSGSMEPNYHVGSIIYVKEVDPFTLKEGDAISFVISENTVATHRIVGLVPDEEDPTVIRFRTKGDANETEDNNLVHYKNVLGKVVWTIPYLGFVSDFVQNPPGTYITIGAAAILVIAVFMSDVLATKQPNADGPPPEQQQEAALEREKLKAELESLKQILQQQENQANQENQKKEGNENEENV